MRNLYKKINAFIQESIVTKSTVKIAAAALIITAVASTLSIIIAENYHKRLLENSISQLASTVKNSASIAAFTSDTQLATEVGRGLLTNHIVKKVTITSNVNNAHQVLITLPANLPALDQTPQIQHLFSPFDAKERVGEMNIWLDESLVKQQTHTYAKLMALIILATLACITGILSWVIYQSITKPIKSIADEMHKLDLHGSALLHIPPKHEHDEIGRLVHDSNQLISHLKTLIKSEHDLYLKHASAEERLRMVFERSQTGMFVIDHHFLVHSWNPALLNLLNLKSSDIAAKHGGIELKQLLPGHYHTLQQTTKKVIKSSEPATATFSVGELSKTQRWLEVSIIAIDAHHMQGIINDVTAHKAETLRAIKISERDPLTQLLNRRGFEPKLDALMQHKEAPLSLALLVIDLDNFKPINDHFGHEAGDFVLKAVSKHLIDSVRKDDWVARLGGDEFAIIINSTELPQLANRISKAIIDTISKPIKFEKKSLKIGASIGIAFSDARSHSPKLLMKHADEAMYMAKQAGKSCYRVYNG